MYTPTPFAVKNQEALHDFIETQGFSILVSGQGGLTASHLPVLLDRQTGPLGTIVGHMARENPQWEQAEGGEVLLVFSGPHAYISPAWYEAENVVPTWNYVTVHAHGKLTVSQDPEVVLQILEDYTAQFEGTGPEAWRFDASARFSQQLARHVVGFSVELTRLEGKWKLSQNHPRERREKVVNALRRLDSPDAQGIAALMQQQLDE